MQDHTSTRDTTQLRTIIASLRAGNMLQGIGRNRDVKGAIPERQPTSIGHHSSHRLVANEPRYDCHRETVHHENMVLASKAAQKRPHPRSASSHIKHA